MPGWVGKHREHGFGRCADRGRRADGLLGHGGWSPIPLVPHGFAWRSAVVPHDGDDAAKQGSSVGSRADRFAASHHERRSCYVFGAGMSAEAKALLGQVVFDDPKGFGPMPWSLASSARG